MSETALFSLSRVHLQTLRRRRHPRSDTLHALLDHPRRLIISILCGNELINIAASVNLAAILLDLYGRPEAAALANIVIMFPLLMVVSEVTPKTLAASRPAAIAGDVVARPIEVWVRLVTPLRAVVRAVSDRITSLVVGPARADRHLLKIDEFRTLLADVAQEGEVSAVERTIIDNLLAADETEVVQTMVPRPRIRYLNAALPTAELLAAFKALRYARVPVYRDNRDDVIGVLCAEDVLRLELAGTEPAATSIDELVRPPLFVPPTKRVEELFALFRRERTNCAFVLNEFGGIDGMVTLHDVIGFVFGELAESDLHRPTYIEEGPHSFLVSASMRLEAFNRLTNLGVEDARMATIGGVVFRLLDRVPREGDVVELPSCTATVVTMDRRRVSKLRITRAGARPGDTPAHALAEPGEPAAPTRDERVEEAEA
jgi:CBS domain containing-hemolysin-like protein